MRLRSLIFLLYLIFCIAFKNMVLACNRRPQGASGDQSPVDDNFQITIEGNPSTYIPGQTYNITLSCAINFKFISFTLVAERERGLPLGYDLTGHFEIIDAAETRFSTQCENMIENSNTNIKNRIDVAWVAPTNPNSTCVYIKAAVLVHRNVWYMDDGFLTKRICAEEIDDINSQTPLVNPCCACDEAKYELVLERRWTRNTHAKNFPDEDWRTRFSEVIGASHTFDYRFWAYGRHASLGLKELAEHGATKNLENEIKEHSNTGSIRTIIKAPGIPFRKNIMGTTLATVRVDPRHHLVSLVTKIIPSPDWILGVAGLELCLANCTWVDRKILNLFPWDVGTDAGPSYMSPDQKQIPADVIRRISSTYPSDYRSPFYDETGAVMKPMATLYITRKKLYERDCEPDTDVSFECTTHPWVDWSECSTKCGPGNQFRVRAYKDTSLAERFNCRVPLRQTQRCVGTQCGLQEDEDDYGTAQNAECALTPWSPWSPCSNSCGRGTSKRSRDFRNPYARESCQNALQYELEQEHSCFGNACGGTIAGYGNEAFGHEPEPGLMPENNYNFGQDNYNDHANEQWNINNRPATFGDINQSEFNNNDMDNDNDNDDRNRNRNRSSDNEDNFTWIGNSDNDDNINGENNNNNNDNEASDTDRWINNNPNRSFGSESSYLDRNNQEIPFNTFDGGNNNGNQYGIENRDYPSRTIDHYSNSRNGGARHKIMENFEKTELSEIYDDNGDKILMAAGIKPNEYSVVQEYCWKKPVVVRRRCLGKKIVSNFWFFDADDRTCKLFTTDNCDENENKFRTIEACEGTCLQPLLNLEEQQQQQQLENQFGTPLSQTRQKNRNTQRSHPNRNRNSSRFVRF